MKMRLADRSDMSKRVVIHQPDFLPYLGFLHRFLHADLWVVLDNVQFVTGTSRSWTNRDIIKTPAGKQWITVAVQKARNLSKINEIRLSTAADWRANNLNLLRENYRKAPFFDEIFPYLRSLYAFEGEMLAEFNIRSVEMLCSLFDISIERTLASSLDPAGKSNELLVDILNKVNATSYLSGVGAKDYFDPKPFSDAGIKVEWQDFKHPVYPQLHGEFVPYLSSIDLLFNCGIAASRTILRSES
jgi:hypothetical protein